MERLAFVELGIRPQEFYDMTVPDWTLCIDRIYTQSKRREESTRLNIELTRRFMALFAQANGAKFATPQDMIPMPYDDKSANTLPEEDRGKLIETIKKLEQVAKKRKHG